jgi:hypothetical protein
MDKGPGADWNAWPLIGAVIVVVVAIICFFKGMA